MPKRRNPLRIVLDSISGRGTTPKYDLIPMGLYVPKCGKNSLCHSVSQRNVLSLRDCQNASSEVTTRRPTPASCHTAWARGQVKNRCEQFSTALAHSRHTLSPGPLHQASSSQEPGEYLDIMREAMLPHQTAPLQEDRILRFPLVPKQFVCCSDSEAVAAPHPRVMGYLRQALVGQELLQSKHLIHPLVRQCLGQRRSPCFVPGQLYRSPQVRG